MTFSPEPAPSWLAELAVALVLLAVLEVGANLATPYDSDRPTFSPDLVHELSRNVGVFSPNFKPLEAAALSKRGTVDEVLGLVAQFGGTGAVDQSLAKRLSESSIPVVRDIALVYLPRTDSNQAVRAAAKLRDLGLVGRVVQAHAEKMQGESTLHRQLEAERRAASLSLTLKAIIVCAAVVLIWLIVDRKSMIGNVGAGISSLKADYYALSAALALLLTDLISIPLTGLISEAPLKMALGLLLGWAVVLCLPWFSGEGIESLEEVGFAGKDIIRKAWIGPIVAIPAFMASTIIFVFTGRFFDSLPSREHPLQTMLTNSPGPLVWACAVFSAVLAAPFVEEVIFRGLLFPALAKRLGSTVGAAILSSLFFASLHSTGPATWPSLAVFGMVSCYLTVKTGSLVPSMAMHGTYNLMMLLMASAF